MPVGKLSPRRARVLVDISHEILVKKLCALLGRCELRDLIDVQALLGAGGHLERAVVDAGTKDGGFSPLTLAWVLERFPVSKRATQEGWSPERATALADFKQQLVERVTTLCRP